MVGSSSRLFRASFVLLGCLLLALGALPVAAQKPGVKYFDETKHNLESPFLEYWQQHDGAVVFGAPITESIDLPPKTQYFQRGCLEQRENGTIVARNLGVELGFSRPPEPLTPNFVNDERQVYVRETGHYLRDVFLRYYVSHGGAAAFGYPISSMEPDGPLILQYFQRAIFEWNPRESHPAAQMKLRALGLMHFARSGLDIAYLSPATPIPTVYAAATVRVVTLARPPGVTPTTGADMIPHRVTWGETWVSIAEKYGVHVDDLLKANGMEVVRAPYVGQELRIPQAAAPAATTPPPTAAPATPIPTATLAQARADPGPQSIQLGLVADFMVVQRGRPETFLVTARDNRGKPLPNVEVRLVLKLSGGRQAVSQVLTDSRGEARVAVIIPSDQAFGMIAAQVQTVPPALAGTASAWFVIF